MYYYGARYYDPVIGRFIQADTIIPGDPTANSQVLNRYTYALNNPLRFTDPSGNESEDTIDDQEQLREEAHDAVSSVLGSGNTGSATEPVMVSNGGSGIGSSDQLDGSAGWAAPAEQGGKSSWIDKTQLALDGIGLIPVIGELADGANALISVGRGNYGEAALSVAAMLPIGGQAATATKLGYKGAKAGLKYSDEAVAAAKLARGNQIVIGKTADLGKLRKGESSLLKLLPDQGTPKANWKQNSGVLRSVMKEGKPIRDASPGYECDHDFLGMERALLKDRGWKTNAAETYWFPPK